MNKWRIAGLSVLVVVAGWLAWRSFMPAEPPPAPTPPPPPREVFHATKPLHVVVAGAANPNPGPSAGGAAPNAQPNEWLARELRFVLTRGKMRIASSDAQASKTAFTLRIELPEPQKSTNARITLLAPDGVTEKQIDAPLELKDRLATVQSLTSYLPKFLGAATATADWGALVGTADVAAYEGFLVGSSALLDSTARGFTQPAHTRDLARSVEQLEALTRKFPTFARAQGLLSLAYLSLGGKDQASLTQIADGTAKRALALDDELADAHSAMGLARLRRGEWIAARERFEAALAVDVNAVPALEGLGCLLAETGQMKAALPVAAHAILMQPGNVGARECLVYARLASSTSAAAPLVAAVDAGADAGASTDLAVVRVEALSAMLAGDLDTAERLLTAAAGADSAWVKSLLNAASNKKAIPEALRAITLAASDGQIDAATEVLCGAALRQADFVFNRMSRLEKQNEAVPLRILWLPQTAFLRQNRRFEQLATAVDLGSYWQEQGRADVCEAEPQVYGCNLRPSSVKQKAARQRA